MDTISEGIAAAELRLDVVPLLEATLRDDVGAAVVLALEAVVAAEVVAGAP